MSENLDLPRLTNVRCYYPKVFTAVDFKGNGKYNFECGFLVASDSEQKKNIDKLIMEGAKAAWGAKADVMLKKLRSDSKNTCWKECDAVEGMWVFSAKRGKLQGRPTVVDRRGQPLTEDDGKPYGGCYVNADVQVWFQGGDTPGIRGRFSGVQFVKDGEVIEGASRVSKFEVLEDEEEDSLI